MQGNGSDPDLEGVIDLTSEEIPDDEDTQQRQKRKLLQIAQQLHLNGGSNRTDDSDTKRAPNYLPSTEDSLVHFLRRIVQKRREYPDYALALVKYENGIRDVVILELGAGDQYMYLDRTNHRRSIGTDNIGGGFLTDGGGILTLTRREIDALHNGTNPFEIILKYLDVLRKYEPGYQARQEARAPAASTAQQPSCSQPQLEPKRALHNPHQGSRY